MAKVTLVIEDTIKDGRAACAINFNVDYQGAEKDAPPTDSLIVATAFQRLWGGRAFAPLAALICDDLLAVTRQRPPVARVSPATAAAVAAVAAAAAPDRQGAEDVKPVEATDAPGPSASEATKVSELAS